MSSWTNDWECFFLDDEVGGGGGLLLLPSPLLFVSTLFGVVEKLHDVIILLAASLGSDLLLLNNRPFAMSCVAIISDNYIAVF